jgi:uncharacterized protein
MKIILSLTHRCNLGCQYCYAGRADRRTMALATAYKAVDFGFQRARADEQIEFSFFGGEPLLCLDLIKAIITYIRTQQLIYQQPIRLSLTTNGTIFSAAIVQLFQTEGIDLCISLDGPASIHDRHRVFKNGAGSFALVQATLAQALAALPAVQVNAVYGPDTLAALPESVAYIFGLGAPSIHINPNICAVWPDESLAAIDPVFQRLADYYIDCYAQGREIAINTIDSKIIVFLKRGYDAADRCGMGRTQWAFAPSGNVYPCERFIGEDTDQSFCLGNIHTGLNEARRCLLLQQTGNRTQACLACPLRHYCMNWCGCTNYAMTGQTDQAGAVLCALERATIRAAQRVLTTLQEEQNELFVDHFMRYVYRDVARAGQPVAEAAVVPA